MRRDVDMEPQLRCKAASESWKIVSPSLNIGRCATVRLEGDREVCAGTKSRSETYGAGVVPEKQGKSDP